MFYHYKYKNVGYFEFFDKTCFVIKVTLKNERENPQIARCILDLPKTLEKSIFLIAYFSK